MKTTNTHQCPKCGLPIPSEAPHGLCPRCLWADAAGTTDVPTVAADGDQIPEIAELAEAFPQLEILECIGSGGMGSVYKARQPALDRLVALKILSRNLAGDHAFAERFAREGRLLARLNHPNIVQVHDFGQAGPFYFLLMEYVDGVNLRQAMRSGDFPPEKALEVVPGVCEALQFAHDEGVLHRDIKPENLLLDRRGRVKIADFGIAKLIEPDVADTRLTGDASLGTPHYMAPEQIEQPGLVDHRADIYSMGVVLYEMLTGELPIGRFAPPSSRPSVNPSLDPVVLRALEKERDRRQQSASELRTEVETAAAHHPDGPGPGQRRRPASVLIGTPLLALALIGAPLLTFVAAIAFSLGFFRSPDPQPPGRPDGSAVPSRPDLPATRTDSGSLLAGWPEGGVELLAVSEHPAGGGGWWRPDGSPAPVAFVNRGARVYPSEGERSIELVFRSLNLEAGTHALSWSSPDWMNLATGGVVSADGEPLDGHHLMAMTLADAKNRLSVRVGLAAGPWSTVARTTGSGSSEQSFQFEGRPRRVAFLGLTETSDGDTMSVVTHDFGEGNLRVVAVDAEGAEHTGSRVTHHSGSITTRFRDLTRSRIRALELQHRPYRWATFTNIVTRPAR